mmetsp:Transcript_7429/g.9585  ORF Transcript_7429/g.9585 Transcript_7429/m.9585 type:complete len:159 (+) Transcript_7429:444-920(+)
MVKLYACLKTFELFRNSRNRPAGTPVTKPIPSVNAEVYRSFLIEKVLPAINHKWPLNDRLNPIKIQQDNAKPHIAPTDESFVNAAQALNLNVELICQPPNSPDLNVLDLGFFHSIQSLQHTESPCKQLWKPVFCMTGIMILRLHMFISADLKMENNFR